jgi:hypothetical protein
MPDLLIFTGSAAAKEPATKHKRVIREINIDFIIKRYHNRIVDKLYILFAFPLPMEILVTKFLMFFAYFISTYALAQQSSNYNNSPSNYQNSQSNYENSSSNYRNSPSNYENSAANYGATNGVYDNNGNRIGYSVQAPSGVTNIFDNNGKRIGYTPK